MNAVAARSGNGAGTAAAFAGKEGVNCMFVTICPKCGRGRLYVVSAIWTGRSPLHEDGFSLEYASGTYDEKVECGSCGAGFELSELTVRLSG